MKRTFLHLLLLSGCVCLLPSCIEDKAEDAAARLTVSKVNVEVIQTGTLSTGSKATLDVLANQGMPSPPTQIGFRLTSRPGKAVWLLY